MRIFWWVIGSLAGIALLGALAWFVGERAVMFVATYRFEQDVAAVRRLAVKNSASSSCGANYVAAYQLRFTGDTTYVFESLCNKGTIGKQLSTHTLFGGVKRLYGSGIQFQTVNQAESPTNAWVQLTYGKIEKISGVFNGVIGSQVASKEYKGSGTTPAQAYCADWGFSCCNDVGEVGEGIHVRTNDCSKSCYQTCNKRPIVLFFNSDPLMDTATREVEIHEMKSAVTFGYEIADYDGSVGPVILDYGDQQFDKDLPAKANDVNHTYVCLKTTCTYTAQLIASDNHDQSLANSSIGSIRIVMRP